MAEPSTHAKIMQLQARARMVTTSPCMCVSCRGPLQQTTTTMLAKLSQTPLCTAWEESQQVQLWLLPACPLPWTHSAVPHCCRTPARCPTRVTAASPACQGIAGHEESTCGVHSVLLGKWNKFHQSYKSILVSIYTASTRCSAREQQEQVMSCSGQTAVGKARAFSGFL